MKREDRRKFGKLHNSNTKIENNDENARICSSQFAVVTWRSGFCATLASLVDQWWWSGCDSIEILRIFLLLTSFFPFSILSVRFYRVFLCCAAIVAEACCKTTFLYLGENKSSIMLLQLGSSEHWKLVKMSRGRKELNQSRLCVLLCDFYECKHWIIFRGLTFFCWQRSQVAWHRLRMSLKATSSSYVNIGRLIHFYCLFCLNTLGTWRDVIFVINFSWVSFYCYSRDCLFSVLCRSFVVGFMLIFLDFLGFLLQNFIYIFTAHKIAQNITKRMKCSVQGCSEEDVNGNFYGLEMFILLVSQKQLKPIKIFHFPLFPLFRCQLEESSTFSVWKSENFHNISNF